MLLHASESVGSHATQLAPATPQLPVARRRHVAPSQQPAAHDSESHTQSPPTQRCPGTHAGPSPHVQLPAVEQPSARIASHAWHTAPPAPHASRVIGRHVLPEQQPEVHVIAQPAHAPAMQLSPAGHIAHC